MTSPENAQRVALMSLHMKADAVDDAVAEISVEADVILKGQTIVCNCCLGVDKKIENAQRVRKT